MAPHIVQYLGSYNHQHACHRSLNPFLAIWHLFYHMASYYNHQHALDPLTPSLLYGIYCTTWHHTITTNMHAIDPLTPSLLYGIYCILFTNIESCVLGFDVVINVWDTNSVDGSTSKSMQQLTNYKHW